MDEEETTETTTEQTPTKETEQAPAKDIASILFSKPGSPTRAQVEQWKTQFGEVHVSGFSEDELYVWRPLMRKEYLALQQKQMESKTAPTQAQIEESVIAVVLLWPTVTDWDVKKAGTLSTLYEQVSQQSNFTTPAMASMLMMKL